MGRQKIPSRPLPTFVNDLLKAKVKSQPKLKSVRVLRTWFTAGRYGYGHWSAEIQNKKNGRIRKWRFVESTNYWTTA